jgi:hypothetical protein
MMTEKNVNLFDSAHSRRPSFLIRMSQAMMEQQRYTLRQGNKRAEATIKKSPNVAV